MTNTNINKYLISYSAPMLFSLQLPLDLSTLTEAERKARVEKRKPRQQIRVMEELEDNFSSDKYLKFIRK